MQKKRTICVAGSGSEESCGKEAVLFAKVLGREIARNGDTLLVGTERGFPAWTAKGAHEEGGTVISISPAASVDEHRNSYRLPEEFYTSILYTGFGISGRDILLVRSSDAVIVGCGSASTLQEFTFAYVQKKPIGVLEGVWKIDDVIHELAEEGIRGEREVVFESDPKRLLDAVYGLI